MKLTELLVKQRIWRRCVLKEEFVYFITRKGNWTFLPADGSDAELTYMWRNHHWVMLTLVEVFLKVTYLILDHLYWTQADIRVSVKDRRVFCHHMKFVCISFPLLLSDCLLIVSFLLLVFVLSCKLVSCWASFCSLMASWTLLLFTHYL